jgi:hypothetical protein
MRTVESISIPLISILCDTLEALALARINFTIHVAFPIPEDIWLAGMFL